MLDEKDVEKICGVVEHISFRNEENGFSVIELSTGAEKITVVGVLPHTQVGETLKVSGKWDFHKSFGRQFKARLCEREMPKNTSDLLKYLSSGAVRGIGPATALKIVEAFGENTFDVLENDIERLASIRGISKRKAKEISEAFSEQFAVREIMIALERYGMKPRECLKAFKAFGNNTVDILRKNPYLLCRENIGIGFERADEIASNISDGSFEKNSRTMAGIVYIISHNLSNGHTCVPRDRLYDPAKSLLSADESEVDEAIAQLLETNGLVSCVIDDREFLFLPNIFKCEKNIASRISLLKKFPPAGKSTLDKEIQKIEFENDIKYEEKQFLAIKTAAEKGMLILTGGPGTGKTTTLNGILKIFEKQELTVALCASTGRAAKRMSELTGHEAKTIHRLLEVEFDSDDRQVFTRNMRNPLDIHAIIIDELSMVDVTLFSGLLDALPLGCRIVLVGDSNQLPPVGAGNVLHDLIEAGAMPVVTLTEVFRQAMESLIVTNAHKIIDGEEIDLSSKDRDFFMIEKSSTYITSATVTQLCAQRLPKAYNASAMNDIQVVCPSKKGETGTANLNRLLQNELNPPEEGKKQINVSGYILREGDKVMQIKNNYDIVWTKDGENGTGIFNGDIGRLKSINLGDATMKIDFDGKIAVYPMEFSQEIELAYAVTVHKSQGNEFEIVVMPVIDVPPRLCYRNLLYTAITRAKKLLIIVGNPATVRLMAENNKVTRRYSALKAFLKDENEV